ncbi:MAG: hypothetical protein K2X27_11685 [Candidatus Obscuribacterales bacterium]|nr:hypothetical protein [Candidatus Obscuribacterales bacterium]
MATINRLYFYRLAFGLLILVWSALVTLDFLRHTNPTAQGQAGTISMVYGYAKRPYVYRTLAPTIVRLLTSAVPQDLRLLIKNSASQALQKTYLELSTKDPFQDSEQDFSTEYLIAALLEYISLLAFLAALVYLALGLYDLEEILVMLIPCIALLVLPPFWDNFVWNKIYDFPTLFLFTASLGLMARGRWTLYLLSFVLASLNKETSILLTIPFLAYFAAKAACPECFFSEFSGCKF